MRLPRLPESMVAAMSLFVMLSTLASMFVMSSFNRYIGLVLALAVAVEVFLFVTKRGGWRSRRRGPEC